MSSITNLTESPATAPQLKLVPYEGGPSSWALATQRVLRLFLFAAPFLLVAAAARNSGLLSSDHARLITQALALHRDPALTTIDYGQPPLLTLLLAVWPNPVAVQYLSALIGGAVAYVLWDQLRTQQIPLWLRSLLVLSFCLTPSVLLVAGMHASDMLALLLLLIAWRSYIKFVHHSITWHGFVAGLLLGLAFFSSFLTLLFVIPFALGAPSYLRSTKADNVGTTSERNKKTRRHAILAGVIVIAFPGVCALVSRMYLAWLGTGDFFHLVNTFGNAGFADHITPGAWKLVRMTGEDLIRQPLYVFVAALMAQRGTRQLIAHLFPLALVTVPRAFGWHYDEGFVAACYIGFAVLGLAVMTAERPNIPVKNVGRLLKTGLAVAAIAQLAVAVVLPLRSDEPQSWRTTLIGSDTAAIRLAEEQEAFANLLKNQPQGVILTSYSASQIISRAESTYPFLLPASDQFVPAIWNPSHIVDHVLLPAEPNSLDGSGLEDVRRDGAIAGFHVDGELAGWKLFTRDDVSDLFP